MINVYDIVEESIVDGEGIRLVVFCQGCKHHCKECQNPGTWSFDYKHLYSPESICELMEQNPLLDGLTLSGGDPFEQSIELLPLVKKVHKKYSIWAYTGYDFEELLKDKDKYEMLKYIDVLVDGRFIAEQRDISLQFRGSKNQRIIDVQESLKNNKIIEHKVKS